MALKGVKAGGTPYHFDYAYLENAPIPASPSVGTGAAAEASYRVLTRNGSEIEWHQVLPDYDDSDTSLDAGKVLSVSDCGNLVWMTSSMVPEIPTDSTVFSPLVLTVNDNSVEWGQINDILCVGGSDGVFTYRDGNVMWSSVFPSYDENDAGKVLTVGQDGDLEWAMPS